MPKVIGMDKAKNLLLVKRGFRNWVTRFQEEFGPSTRLKDISFKTLSFLAQAQEKETFYIYDLVMSLRDWGSGFEFHELDPQRKMAVIDQYIFLLDQIRFECMRRMDWLESYPGQDTPLVELLLHFDTLGPRLQAQVPMLSRKHYSYHEYETLNTYEKESFVRKLIPKLLKDIRRYADSRE